MSAVNEPATHDKHAQYCSCALRRCPCGYLGDPVKECTCSNSTISRYQKKIRGPLLDRIGIYVEVPRVDFEKLADSQLGESSSAILTRVEAARKEQRERPALSMYRATLRCDLRRCESSVSLMRQDNHS
jgi:magnesium chelatase family protein